MKLSNTKKPKIFVTTGSVLEFDLLSETIDELNKNKKYSIIIQIGCGKYIPKNCNYFKFSNSLDKYYKWADLVITHTGAGTLFELLEKNKKIISVANPKAVNNHGLPLWLDKQNYVKYIHYNYINIYNFKKNICGILNNQIKFKKYKKNKQTIGQKIFQYIDNLK
jgi:beta-1,4-N-acetylglucosaminyltransferase